jgi:hypothetical protein
MITGIVLGCYAVAWLLTARLLYGKFRASSIDANIRRYPSSYPAANMPGALEKWNNVDRPIVMGAAVGAALAWPLIPIALLVIRFLDSAPQLSQAEMRDRLNERDKRIAELERETGIRP